MVIQENGEANEVGNYSRIARQLEINGDEFQVVPSTVVVYFSLTSLRC